MKRNSTLAPSEIRKVWTNFLENLSDYSIDFPRSKIDVVLAGLFCPGPFYYYLFDMSAEGIKFTYIHDRAREIIGIDPETASLPDLLNLLHPSDIDFFLKSEEKLGEILFRKIDPTRILDYKASYCMKTREINGKSKIILHQAIGLTVDDQNRLGTVLGVHTDISHITQAHNYTCSLIDLKGIKSFLSIDPFEAEKEDFDNKIDLTSRELEILRLMSEGYTAQQVADLLHISTSTVRTHRQNFLKKTRTHNTTELVAKCIREGLI